MPSTLKRTCSANTSRSSLPKLPPVALLRFCRCKAALFACHRGRFNFQHPALGDSINLAGGIFEIVSGSLELRFAGCRDFHAIGELHHILMCTTTKREHPKEKN